MKKIRVGLIGCGKQAGKHISSLNRLPGVELILSDLQNEYAEKLASESRATWVKDLDGILSDESIQAVVICTPTQTHVPLIEASVMAGKDVFCEKPLSHSVEDSKHLEAITKLSKQIVLMGYVYRYVPVYEEGFKLFREQMLEGNSMVMGRPLSGFFRLGGRGSHQAWKHRKSEGGGAINEMLVHMIDLASWYFGPLRDIEVVSCDLRCPERNVNGESIPVDAEDYIMVRCYGAHGTEIFCQADLITPAFSQYVEIQAENGTFMGSIQPDMPSYVFLKEANGGFIAGKTELSYGRRNIFDLQMLYFIRSVLNRKLPDRNTVEDSIQLVDIINEISSQSEELMGFAGSRVHPVGCKSI